MSILALISFTHLDKHNFSPSYNSFSLLIYDNIFSFIVIYYLFLSIFNFPYGFFMFCEGERFSDEDIIMVIHTHV